MSKAEMITLKNGLKIGVDEMHDVETVSIGVFVHTGSRNETKEINGISHFLEHLAFKGTKKRSAKTIAEEFESIGGYINAYTSREKTVYYVKILKEYSEFAVEFLSDIIQNSVFKEEEIKKECDVILQELAMTNDTPDDIIFDYFQDVAFPNQALGAPIIGNKKNILKFQKKDFLSYIKNQYNYGNMAIVASGNITLNELKKLTEKYFDNLSSNKIEKVQKAKYFGGDFYKQKKLEQIHCVLGYEGVSYFDDDYYKAQILALILGGGMSSRLFQEIRENLGLAYSIYAFNSNYEDAGTFAIYGASDISKAKEMMDGINLEVEKATKKITEKELQKVKTQFKASLKMAKESTSKRMQKIGSEILIFNKIFSDQEIIEKFEDISIKDIKNVAQKIFASKQTKVVMGELKKAKVTS
ncbi:MAG: M16 family metallopeptidase [Alphaproteobacteria bacterium]